MNGKFKMKIVTFAYAKINLFLAVMGKRPDGYHDIESVMQTVSLADTVTVEAMLDKAGDKQISLSCSLPSLECKDTNIAYRAAALFMDLFPNKKYSINIHIDKKIPVAAGLAGGSADAAATLIALNKIYGNPLSRAILADIGARVGSDVPFCIMGGTRIAHGRGEILASCTPMPDCYIVIACPYGATSTKEAYARIDALGIKPCRTLDEFLPALDSGNIDTIGSALYNMFEDAAEADTARRLDEVKNIMTSHRAVGALMSGSGPAIFGLFARHKDAVSAADALMSAGITPEICRPVFDMDM